MPGSVRSPSSRDDGRSPTSLVRQLYDLKSGARRGGKSSEMDKVLKDMTINDMLALAAYLGSLTP